MDLIERFMVLENPRCILDVYSKKAIISSIEKLTVTELLQISFSVEILHYCRESFWLSFEFRTDFTIKLLLN